MSNVTLMVLDFQVYYAPSPFVRSNHIQSQTTDLTAINAILNETKHVLVQTFNVTMWKINVKLLIKTQNHAQMKEYQTVDIVQLDITVTRKIFNVFSL